MTWQANYVKMTMVNKLLDARWHLRYETQRKEQYQRLLQHEENKYNHIRSLYADVVDKIHRVNPDSAFLPPEMRQFSNVPYRYAVRECIDLMTSNYQLSVEPMHMHYTLLEFLEMKFYNDKDLSGQVHFICHVTNERGNPKRVGYTYDQMAFHTIRRDAIDYMAKNIARMMHEELAKQY